MKKELKIFDRKHFYLSTSEIEEDIETAKIICEKIREPQILSYIGLEIVNFYIKQDRDFMGHDLIWWINDEMKEKIEASGIRERFLKCSVEDKEWTKENNKNRDEILYRKITFLPEVQEMVIEKMKGYISDLENLKAEMLEEKRKLEEERNRRKAKWNMTVCHAKIMPSGGEDRKDGLIDAEYESESGEKIRMITRDVYDFGVYSYPERFDATENVLEKKNWTPEERNLARWINEFGEFRGIRM